MDNNQWSTQQMFEYLRDDLKANREENRLLAQETNRKIDSLTDMLRLHVTDDTKNFKDLTDSQSKMSERIACIEVTGTTVEKVKERNWTHFSGWITAAIAFGTMLVIYFQK